MARARSAVADDAFSRWAGETLRALLLAFWIEAAGRAVDPNGLRWRKPLYCRAATAATMSAATCAATPLRGPIPVSLARREEPEVWLAWLALRAILEHFELLVGGQPVEPDALALRNLDDWTFPQRDPAPMLAALSMPCPYACEFCYEEGLPDRAAPQLRGRISNAELRAREALWRRGRDLPGFRGLRYGEILPHPRFRAVLRVVRELTGQPTAVATAGAGLSEATIRALAGEPRVLLQFSLNTCDPERRRRLMGDRQGARVVSALELLREHDVAVSASAVAWPTVPWDDLEATIRVAARHGAMNFILFLPSFTRFFSAADPFDWRERWGQAVEFVRRLRPAVPIPLRIAPDSWEAAHAFGDPLAAEVIGTTMGSPAQTGGLRPEDIVTTVDGAAVLSRPALNRALEAAQSAGRAVHLTGERNGAPFGVALRPATGRGASHPDLDAPFGLHLYEGPDEEVLIRSAQLLSHLGYRRAWVLSGQLLAQPYARLWVKLRRDLPGADVELEFIPVPNLFWGGNVLVGDLLTAGDFAGAVVARLEAGAAAPEVLLVPPTPFHRVWWKDLTGASFLEIERLTGLPALAMPFMKEVSAE